jgi:L-ascorbate metabolism protein UlaG (beta-lactamase superfamily)
VIVTFFGHAAVGLTAERSPSPGFKVLIDPYEPGALGGRIGYAPIAGRFDPDVILVTHDHADHSYTAPWPDVPVIRPTSPDSNLLDVAWTLCHHDAFEGRLRGGTTGVARLELDGIHVVHTGDLGELPGPEILEQWRPCDLLLVASGGYYTLGPAAATELSRRLGAAATVPLHTATDACTLPHLRDVEELVARMPTAERRTGQWRYTRPHRAGLVLIEPA